MSKLIEAFRGYASDDLLDRLAEGGISDIKVNINKQEKTMNAVIQFGKLVSQQDILVLENELKRSLELGSVRVSAKYPPELFTSGYLPESVMQLKRDNATLHGTFKDAEARIEYNRFIITLYHGGEAVKK